MCKKWTFEATLPSWNLTLTVSMDLPATRRSEKDFSQWPAGHRVFNVIHR